MERFDELLGIATENITADFIRFPIDGGDRELFTYRERVYCYELYHQLRIDWDDYSDGYQVSGEVDKGGHPILRRRGIRSGIPDLLVHLPGLDGMSFNYAVIEVKGPRVKDPGIKADLIKLDRFVRLADYQRAIFLVYASGRGRNDEWVQRVNRITGEAGIETPIEIWLHPEPYTKAVRAFPPIPARPL